MTLSRADLLRLLEDNRLAPSRALGQNFVADPNTVRRVVRLSGTGRGDHVVEVGAGLGSLTLALAESGACVTAIERDRWLVPVLREVLQERAPGAAVRVVEADAMELDWPGLLAGDDDWALVANLPYNIATPLVADLLDTVGQVRRMTFMVQREVAERLVAEPGGHAYGAVSVKVAYWAEAAILGSVPSSVFVPRPKVGSAIVGISRRPRPAVDPAAVTAEALFAVVRAGFAQRRKMLRRALFDLAVPTGAFELAGVDGQARAEQLSVEQWGKLAAAITSLRGERLP
ncbi:MAG TPA: 16S rRNA (adenine(1518)-N(6)/adenine(1519)-N(6))-dimethyltransferase RsmA [Acidimicrobiales bacterium]|nr:16S rRNA (adenine(1518)-N(6)/adenine(1519)-N(6))-dimethyltransferase RsmA [Acidimicrobiales bacterium]